MSYHGTNPNDYDFPTAAPAPRYRSLASSTRAPNSPVVTINPFDPPFQVFTNAYNSGHLNINYNDVVARATGYYGINTGYGKDPINLYANRTCTGVYKPQFQGYVPAIMYPEKYGG